MGERYADTGIYAQGLQGGSQSGGEGMKEWNEKLNQLGACPEALVWAEDYESLEEAWQKCERGDWMLWLAGRLSGRPESKSRKLVVLATCQCAKVSLKYVQKG